MAGQERNEYDSLEPFASPEAAAEHDAWFRAEVEKPLREADDPNAEWISNDEMKRISAEWRAKWAAEAAQRRKAS